MPRYGINVQYAPSPWEKVMPAIGNAIDIYQRDQDSKRAEENQVAAMGGVPVGTPGPSRLDRVRSFLKKKVLGQTDAGAPSAPQGTEPFVPAGTGEVPVSAQVPAVAGYTAPGGAATLGGATPRQATPPRRIGDALLYDPSTIKTDPRTSSFFGDGTPATTAPASAAPVVRSGAGNAPTPPAAAAAPAAGSIGDALKPYAYRAASGQKYEIDPMRASNISRAAKRGEVQDEVNIKGAERDKDRQEQIDALVAAGMSPAVARAKVLNNVVKYDEQFGAPRKAAMTQQDRMQLQDRIDKRTAESRNFALRLEQLRQQGRSSTREFQELSIKLRQQAQDDANDRALLAADEAEAGRTERAVTTLQTNPVVSATPEGQKAITDAKGAAAAAGAKADASRGRIANKPRGGAAPRATINQQQYEAARAKINPATGKPYTDAEIEQHYTIHPSVKRK